MPGRIKTWDLKHTSMKMAVFELMSPFPITHKKYKSLDSPPP